MTPGSPFQPTIPAYHKRAYTHDPLPCSNHCLMHKNMQNYAKQITVVCRCDYNLAQIEFANRPLLTGGCENNDTLHTMVYDTLLA